MSLSVKSICDGGAGVTLESSSTVAVPFVTVQIGNLVLTRVAVEICIDPNCGRVRLPLHGFSRGP